MLASPTFSPTHIPNSESSLTPAFPPIPHPAHQQIFSAFGLNAITATTLSWLSSSWTGSTVAYGISASFIWYTVYVSPRKKQSGPYAIVSSCFSSAQNPSVTSHLPRIKCHGQGTSLAVQWLRLCLPGQGVWVQSLVRELTRDPTCLTTEKPEHKQQKQYCNQFNKD